MKDNTGKMKFYVANKDFDFFIGTKRDVFPEKFYLAQLCWKMNRNQQFSMYSFFSKLLIIPCSCFRELKVQKLNELQFMLSFNLYFVLTLALQRAVQTPNQMLHFQN